MRRAAAMGLVDPANARGPDAELEALLRPPGGPTPMDVLVAMGNDSSDDGASDDTDESDDDDY